MNECPFELGDYLYRRGGLFTAIGIALLLPASKQVVILRCHQPIGNFATGTLLGLDMDYFLGSEDDGNGTFSRRFLLTHTKEKLEGG